MLVYIYNVYTDIRVLRPTFIHTSTYIGPTYMYTHVGLYTGLQVYICLQHCFETDIPRPDRTSHHKRKLLYYRKERTGCGVKEIILHNPHISPTTI